MITVYVVNVKLAWVNGHKTAQLAIIFLDSPVFLPAIPNLAVPTAKPFTRIVAFPDKRFAAPLAICFHSERLTTLRAWMR